MRFSWSWPAALAFSCGSVSFGFWLLLEEPFAGAFTLMTALSGGWAAGLMFRDRHRRKGLELSEVQIRDDDDRRWPDVIEARHWWVFLLASILWLAVCYWLAARSLRRGEDVVDVALAVNMSTGLIFLAGAMFDRWRSPRSGG
jgi:hypothetical protein